MKRRKIYPLRKEEIANKVICMMQCRHKALTFEKNKRVMEIVKEAIILAIDEMDEERMEVI